MLVGTNQEMIRALITDDHAVVRRGLKELLTDSRKIEVLGEASNAREAMDQVRTGRWDVVILDINLPDRNGSICCATSSGRSRTFRS